MTGGFGLLLSLAGLGLLFDREAGGRATKGRELGALLLLVGSGIVFSEVEKDLH